MTDHVGLVRDRFLQCRVDAATLRGVARSANANGLTIAEWLRDTIRRQLAEDAAIDRQGQEASPRPDTVRDVKA